MPDLHIHHLKVYRVLHELGTKYYISNEQGNLVWLDKAGFALTEELPSKRSRVVSKPKLSKPTVTYRLKRFYKPDHSYSRQLRHCKPVVNPTKLSIFERDNYLCFYCLYRGTAEDLTVDHQTPKSKGGTNDSGNLVTCCIPCNRAKGDLTEDEFWAMLAKGTPTPRNLGDFKSDGAILRSHPVGNTDTRFKTSV